MLSARELVRCPAGDECEFLKAWHPWQQSDPRSLKDTHDFVLGLETADPASVARFMAALIAGTDTPAEIGLDLNLALLTNDPGDLARFVEVHNWNNPEVMATVGRLVRDAMSQAFESESHRRTVEIHRMACEGAS